MVEISSSKPITVPSLPFAASAVLLMQYFCRLPFAVLGTMRALRQSSVTSLPVNPGATLLFAAPIFSQISAAVRGNVLSASNEKPTPGVTSEARIQTASHSSKEKRF